MLSEDLSNDSRARCLKEALEYIGITPDQKMSESFLTYYDMMIEKNKVMNLTRITEFEDAVKRHFADSLAVTKYIRDENVSSMIDIGTGAGFPGIPLAIVYPCIRLTMVDSVGKKINFVKEVIAELGLRNAEALHARAEELAADRKYREKYDICVSRAVANMSSLSEYCLPFVRKDGLFIAFKSGDSDEEIKTAENAVRILGGTKTEVIHYELYDMGRTFVKIRKGKPTPAKYPRKAGIPSKNPL